MNILWVENHKVFADIAAKSFLSAHAVTVVPSLAAAREALATMSFDIVLLDYDLDDGKGATLVPELLRLDNRPAIIATSSHDDGNNAILAAGADAVCGKLRFRRIEEIIEQVTCRAALSEGRG
jgi:DNA-binding response OmpR family regulator